MITIALEGYVNEVKSFDWGTVARVSHTRRAKNDQTGEWENAGYDYFDVTVPQGTFVAEKTVVAVEGTLVKIEGFIKKDGTAGASAKVRAQSINPVDRRDSAASASDSTW